MKTLVEVPSLCLYEWVAPRCTFLKHTPIDKGVSRRHAVLNRIKRTISITDLKSRNGTYLNGDRLIPQQVRFLRHGDEIHLGKLVFRIHFE